MDSNLIRAFLETKNGWYAIVIFILYIIFKLIIYYFEQKRAKSKEEIFVKASKTKDAFIESINRRLKIISDRYNAELSKKAAIIVLQNIYANFSFIIIEEINELKRAKEFNFDYFYARFQVLNYEKIAELENFLYRNRELMTFTSGQIIDYELIKELVEEYKDKNGMLSKEVKTLIEKEVNKILKRL